MPLDAHIDSILKSLLYNKPQSLYACIRRNELKYLLSVIINKTRQRISEEEGRSIYFSMNLLRNCFLRKLGHGIEREHQLSCSNDNDL